MHTPHGTACARSGSGGPCTWSIAAPGPRQRSTQATARSSITCKGQHAPPGRPHHSLLTRFCQHRGRPRMLHGQRVALPVAVGDGCIHPQASGERWGMGGRACRLQLVPACPRGRPTADADQVVAPTWSASRWASGGRAARLRSGKQLLDGVNRHVVVAVGVKALLVDDLVQDHPCTLLQLLIAQVV